MFKRATLRKLSGMGTRSVEIVVSFLRFRSGSSQPESEVPPLASSSRFRFFPAALSLSCVVGDGWLVAESLVSEHWAATLSMYEVGGTWGGRGGGESSFWGEDLVLVETAIGCGTEVSGVPR